MSQKTSRDHHQKFIQQKSDCKLMSQLPQNAWPHKTYVSNCNYNYSNKKDKNKNKELCLPCKALASHPSNLIRSIKNISDTNIFIQLYTWDYSTSITYSRGRVWTEGWHGWEMVWGVWGLGQRQEHGWDFTCIGKGVGKRWCGEGESMDKGKR